MSVPCPIVAYWVCLANILISSPQDFIMGLFGKSKGSDPKEQVNIGQTSMCSTETAAR